MSSERVTAEKQSSLLRAFLRLTRICTVVLLVITVASFFARFHWRCEQFCHFRLQYGSLFLIAGAVFLAAKDRRFAIVSAAAALANIVLVLPIYVPGQQPSVSGPTWKLISHNVLSSNDNYADVEKWLREQKADVVLLMEVDHRWAAAIERLRDEYPHQHVVARDDNFGIALVTRIAWQDVQTVTLGPAQLPSIAARFDNESVQATFIGTHPLPPGSAKTAALRNEQFLALAQFVRQREGPVVLAGDLNVTSYSPYFRELLERSQLRDSRQGFGIQASWSPRLRFLTIPIDHCLVSEEVAVLSRRVGPFLGSDHRPVIVELKTN